MVVSNVEGWIFRFGVPRGRQQEVIRSIKRGKVWLLLNLPEDSYLKLILI